MQHWSLGHIKKNLVLANVVLLCQFLLFDAVQHNDSVLADFGFIKQRPALARFILFTVIAWLTPSMNRTRETASPDRVIMLVINHMTNADVHLAAVSAGAA